MASLQQYTTANGGATIINSQRQQDSAASARLAHTRIDHAEIVHDKLHDKQMRTNLTSAMHTLQHNRGKLIAQHYMDWQGLRTQAQNVKNNALLNLGERLTTFEQNASKNGIKVHWASTPEEACAVIYEIIKAHGIELVLKGKSMASEEIGLNNYLRQRGVIAEETDLGELILQLNHETPVHIVVPAIHRNRYEVGRIFAANLHVADEHDPEKLNAIAREHLRHEFAGLKLGISGVNFALAQEGGIWLIENEGNGRMCTTAPDIHVAICGIEKVVSSLDDAATLMHLLTPSATGQFIPAYQNIITGPRKDGELDGPKEVHVVLFDHNRSHMLQDEDFYQALRCIRCGCCMNFCPVYDKIGGHSYQTTYPGPIGEVISPSLFGLDEVGDILSFCSQCKRCSEVCPERIPLADLIRTLRAFKCKQIEDQHRTALLQGYHENKEDKAKSLAIKMFTKAATNGNLWHFALGKAYTMNFFMKRFGYMMPLASQWSKFKSLPEIRDNFFAQVAKLKDVEIK